MRCPLCNTEIVGVLRKSEANVRRFFEYNKDKGEFEVVETELEHEKNVVYTCYTCSGVLHDDLIYVLLDN